MGHPRAPNGAPTCTVLARAAPTCRCLECAGGVLNGTGPASGAAAGAGRNFHSNAPRGSALDRLRRLCRNGSRSTPPWKATIMNEVRLLPISTLYATFVLVLYSSL